MKKTMFSLLDCVYTREEQCNMFETPIYIYESNEYMHIPGIPESVTLNAFYGLPESEEELEKLLKAQERELSTVFNDVKNGKTLFSFSHQRLAHDKMHFVRFLYVYTPSLYVKNAVQLSCFEVHERSFTNIEFIPNNHTTHETAKSFTTAVPIVESGLTFFEPWHD